MADYVPAYMYATARCQIEPVSREEGDLATGIDPQYAIVEREPDQDPGNNATAAGPEDKSPTHEEDPASWFALPEKDTRQVASVKMEELAKGRSPSFENKWRGSLATAENPSYDVPEKLETVFEADSSSKSPIAIKQATAKSKEQEDLYASLQKETKQEASTEIDELERGKSASFASIQWRKNLATADNPTYSVPEKLETVNESDTAPKSNTATATAATQAAAKSAAQLYDDPLEYKPKRIAPKEGDEENGTTAKAEQKCCTIPASTIVSGKVITTG